MAAAMLSAPTGAAMAGGRTTTAHVEAAAPTAQREAPVETDAARYAEREAQDRSAAPFRGGGTSTLVISGGTVTVVLLIVLLVILL